MKKYITGGVICAAVLIIMITVALILPKFISMGDSGEDTDLLFRPRDTTKNTAPPESEKEPLPSTPIVSFALSETEITVNGGDTYYVGVAAYPREGIDPALFTAVSENIKLISVRLVNGTMSVFGLADGKTEITVKYDGEVIGKVSVTVVGEYIPETEPPETEPPIIEDPPIFAQSDRIDPSKPMIALTFDDGPSKTTVKLLDAFREYNCHGTFFIVGTRIQNYKNSIIRMAEEGHELGIHTWSHVDLRKLTLEEVKSQVSTVRNSLYDLTGIMPKLVRPPYGAVNSNVKTASVEDDFYIVNWNIDTEDWKLRNADKIYDAVMSQAKDGAIILLHDLHAETVEAIVRAIPDLIAKGYQLVTVSELLSYSPTEPQTGTVIRHR